MLLSEVFNQLAYGELTHLALGGQDTGISPENYPRIIAQINLGLTALHRRFCLREEEVKILQTAGIHRYRLHNSFAASNLSSPEANKFIHDLPPEEPFRNNVLKIEEIFDEDDKELVLEDKGNSKSLLLPRYDTVYVPDPVPGTALRVVYRADHPRLDMLNADVQNTELLLPDACMEPLLAYVGYRLLSNMGGEQAIAGDKQLQRYEMFCQAIEQQRLFYRTDYKNQRFQNNGWK